MKIHVFQNDKKRKFYFPTSVLYMRPVIGKLIQEAKLEVNSEQANLIARKIHEYVHHHKGELLTEVDVLSADGEYVYVEIYL